MRNSGAGGRQAVNQCGMVRNCGGIIRSTRCVFEHRDRRQKLSLSFVNPAGTCRRNPVVSCTGARSATGVMQLGLGRVCVRAAPRGVHRRAAMGRDAPFTYYQDNHNNNNKMPLNIASIAVERHGNISSHLPVEMYGNNNITTYSSTTCTSTSQTSTCTVNDS